MHGLQPAAVVHDSGLGRCCIFDRYDLNLLLIRKSLIRITLYVGECENGPPSTNSVSTMIGLEVMLNVDDHEEMRHVATYTKPIIIEPNCMTPCW